MNIISIKKQPEYASIAIKYFQEKWASKDSLKVYEDCINNCITSNSPLPQWYLLLNNDEIVGCAGLITNDFISRMDLYPWMCALYVEEKYRGNSYGSILLDEAKKDALNAGFAKLYLCTDHIGYYEHYDFNYIGIGYHPWGDESRIYEADLAK
ncbi:putative acetyltransferase [[Clostridium] sordellii]|uniref:GNAT family N-acetyltransferase n=1 Tax=Paraclostridium sordellii TaxID=1505 RepID=UPI0005E1C3C1|nr:GNAT family N-acetyltransferase [Paeniclostridium sordellii]MCR1850941.1 GNAT family N-acetyltransferase [Paeniclostridium sordellii]CEN23264.1 putative acetyltransferase [[Clostridium] sordellii] [Paeniclostridium sordellii]